MDCIQTSNKQVDKFGAGRHGFSAGNPSTGVLATLLSPDWCDGVQQEFLNTLYAAGVEPDANDLAQVAKVIASGVLSYGIDFGVANAVRATMPIPPVVLVDGQQFWVKIAVANTGATTFTPNNGVVTAYPVVGLGGIALQSGELVAGGRALFVWNAATSTFVLVTCSGGALQIKAATKSSHAVNLGMFGGLAASNGYFKVPNPNDPNKPFLVQYASGSASPPVDISFPLAFPNKCLRVIVCDAGVSPGIFWGANAASFDSNKFQIFGLDKNGNNIAVGAYQYIAIGN